MIAAGEGSEATETRGLDHKTTIDPVGVEQINATSALGLYCNNFDSGKMPELPLFNPSGVVVIMGTVTTGYGLSASTRGYYYHDPFGVSWTVMACRNQT